MQLYKYSDLGRALAAAEVDGNWTAIETAIADLQTAGVRIQAVRSTADGQAIEFVGTDESILGVVAIPTPFALLGDWMAGVDYSTRHIVSREGVTYLCAVPHTSSTFADDLAADRWFTIGAAGGEPPEAADVPYTPAPGSLITGAETVQAAIDMLAQALEMTQTAISDLENELELRLQAIEGRLDALEA